MANVDNPRGFWPIRHLSGGEIRPREYVVTTGATIYRGEVLKVVAAGTVEQATADDGIIVIGIAAEYVSDSASAGGKKILVYDDPKIVFGVQVTTAITPTAADIFAGGDHVAGSGDSATLMSTDEFNLTSGEQFKCLGLINSPKNSWAQHAKVEVVFNEHLNNAAVASV